MATSQDLLKTLIHKRGLAKGKLTRFKSFFDNFTEGENLNQLKLRLSKLEHSWTEFEEVQLQIELADVEVDHTDERKSFEELYFDIYSEVEKYISDHTQTIEVRSSTQSHSSSHNADSTHIPVKLPTINLPTFTGRYEEWMPFYDSFQALIDKNTNLSNIQKLHYLNGAVKGEAAETIRNVELTSLNYDVALSLLKERYQNTRIIKQNHIKALFELPQIQRDSSSSLRQLINGLHTHIRALTALSVETEGWDPILVHFITSKLDPITHKEWEHTTKPDEMPTLKELTDFLQKKCQTLENVSTARNQNTTKTQHDKPTLSFPRNNNAHPQHRVKSFHAIQETICCICDGKHPVFQCEELLNASHQDRMHKLSKARLCINCLHKGHQVKDCTSRGCRKCGNRHNTALHFPTSTNNKYSDTRTYNPKTSSSGSSLSCTSNLQGRSEVLLSTALIDVIGFNGKKVTCRAFLDNGSQSNFITEDACQKLGLKKEKVSVVVTGVDMGSTHVTYKTGAKIQSRNSFYQTNAEFLVLPRITGPLPTTSLNITSWKIPNGLTLADPNFHEPNKIDVLLGQEYFLDILDIGKINVPKMPVLQNTRLGWIFGGRAISNIKNTSTTSCNLTIMERIDQQLQAFWKQEEPTTRPPMSLEEQQCELHYATSVQRSDDGRYTVKMPLKISSEMLGTSKNIAQRRFHQVERRLQVTSKLHEQYSEFMREYELLGHMEEVEDRQNDSPEYFLPHHPIIKESSSTTKLRVVFDASAKTSTDLSLNNIMMVGPTIQDDLFSIILRFRIPVYVITADIEKMYRQIWIDPSQRMLLQILWREDPIQPIKNYQLNTVSYGTACAPYLAIKTLHQLAHDEASRFPEASKVLLKDFYVDDMLTGADSLEDVVELQTQLIGLLQSGGFNLRKWNSNKDYLLQHLPSDILERQPQEFPSDINSSTKKALGLLWDARRDELQFKHKPNQDTFSKQLTKRAVLSETARLFDPLGLAAPIVIRAKMFLQQLWKHQLGWDEPLPELLQNKWNSFEECLKQLDKLHIPRGVTLPESGGTLQLHGFSDASEQAYGGAVYIKHTLTDGTSQVTLLCSKSRVSPLKTISLPRLELCGALLLAELVDHVNNALTGRITSINYWTDSTIVLAWLAAEPASWKTFVANRVAKIQTLSNPCDWKHVRSEDNPADLVSRGTRSTTLSTSPLWWSGPSWLKEHPDHWPVTSQPAPNYQEAPEKKNTTVSAASITTAPLHLDTLNRFSSLWRLQRVTAYCNRFIYNCRHPGSMKTGALSTEELTTSLRRWLILEQKRCFTSDILHLEKNGHVHNKSGLITLRPFLDQNNLIRVGGRLAHSHIKYDQQHPVILPEKSHLTEIIATYEHIRNLHAGPQMLLSQLRLKYWPINGRNLARKIVHSCVTCFKSKPKWTQPEMGDLPSLRTSPTRPFKNCGTDYCGPIYIRSGRNRKSQLVKSYVAIFVCFATKAVHIELVSDLTTEAFLAAFRRFVSRRGMCSNIYSDNGTNFVGARKELQQLSDLMKSKGHQQKVIDATSIDNVSWHFIPPRSPHFGGLWEAGVKSIKYHLRRVVGKANLTFEGLTTTLTMIEACLNSRPLTLLSSDPLDPSPLTPGHFLIGEALTSVPEPDYTSVPENRLSHWQRSQQLTQHFWKRWSREYLTTLQERQKWHTRTVNLQLGQVVMLREDNLPPLKWVIGIVEELHPGSDGRCRVATVRTSSGNFKRAVNRLCVLPIDA